MRLRTFESFWLLRNGLLFSYPCLQKNISTDIVVVGGGITGALISHQLIQDGYDVTIIDKRDIGQGSTSATTSMLQYEIDVPFIELAKMIGEKEAAECYLAGIEAIKKLEIVVKDEKIDCGFVPKKSLYIAHNKKAAKWLYDEFELRNKYKLGVKWLTGEEVLADYGIKCDGGILSEVAASIDAYKFTHELIHKNVGKGLKVYDQTEIKGIVYREHNVEIKTVSGCSISCNKIVFCSGYETLDIVHKKLADLKSTFACVSEQGIEIPAELNDILVWDTRDPYLYMRTTEDGRLLIGGEDSSINSGVFRENNKNRKSKALMKQLKEMMPGVNFIEDFNWAGIFGTTKDGLPYIGTDTKFPNAIFVMGFGGNGITFSVQGMQIVSDILAGKENSLKKYYRFDR